MQHARAKLVFRDAREQFFLVGALALLSTLRQRSTTPKANTAPYTRSVTRVLRFAKCANEGAEGRGGGSTFTFTVSMNFATEVVQRVFFFLLHPFICNPALSNEEGQLMHRWLFREGKKKGSLKCVRVRAAHWNTSSQSAKRTNLRTRTSRLENFDGGNANGGCSRTNYTKPAGVSGHRLFHLSFLDLTCAAQSSVRERVRRRNS